MCASFSAVYNDSSLKQIIPTLLRDRTVDFKTVAATIFPFKPSKVIVMRGEHPVLTVMRYALTPHWAKEEKVKFATYNARLTRPHKDGKSLEHIYEAPTWRGAFGKKHCVVPMTSFFEACHAGESAGHMVEFSPNDDEIVFVAGLYDEWVNPKTGEVLSSFAIITTEPSAQIEKVGHDRMPVFLKREDILTWLGGFKTAKDAYGFLTKNYVTPDVDHHNVRSLKNASANLELPLD